MLILLIPWLLVQGSKARDVSSLAISKTKIALCDYDGSVEIRKKEDGKVDKVISMPGGARYVRWTTGGSRLVVAGPKRVATFARDGLSAGRTLSLLPWKEVSALDVAADGSLVAIGTHDGELILWNPAAGTRR